MYESAPHYCIMIPLMMLYLNREVSIGLCLSLIHIFDNDGPYRIEFIVGTVKQDPGETLGLFMVEMKPSGSTKP